MFNLSEKELEILKFWQERQIFRKTLKKEAPKGDFVFYEGPPTANGKPGIHHVEARAFKDVIPRFKTMNGFKVERKAGWDTHGLPVELEVEKQLGLKNKKEVEAYGIKEFNEKCKESVWQYVSEWEKMTERIGFWVDMKQPYITYHNDYIETLWWIIKQAYEKGLMYQGHKVIPQCPRCGTALSSHEVAQGYRNIKEESVYIKFKLKAQNAKVKTLIQNLKLQESDNIYILAWTTTPWTLPGNVALAVGKDIEYALVKREHANNEANKHEYHANEEDEYYILASDLVEKVFGDEVKIRSLGYARDKVVLGKDLVGLEYEPLFSLDNKEEILKLKHGKKQATAPVIIKDNKILLGLREYSKTHNVEYDFWVGPGGRSEENETLEETLRRELKEECNIVDYKIKKHLGSNPSYVVNNLLMHWFLIEVDDYNQIKNGEPDKFKEWKWFDINEIPDNIPHKNDLEYYKQALAWNKAYKVYPANFVSTEDGTGVVHTAVMYGIEDYELGEEIGLPKVHTVNLDGTFKKLKNQNAKIKINEFYEKIEGKFVKDADNLIIEYLRENNLLFKTEMYGHDYPFCWRCDTPLIYYAKDSWFFKMSALREQMIKSNETINWVPEHIKEGRFGEWLKEVKDWAISRERYWGTPIPVWKCQTGNFQFPRLPSASPQANGGQAISNFQINSKSQIQNSKNGCGNTKVIGSYEELPVFQALKNNYYLLRHGEAENNVQDILCSKLENDHFHLTAHGREQIEQLLPYFFKEKIDLIIHSPFVRTTETAEIVAKKLKASLEKNDLLWELGVGAAEGKSDQEFEQLAGPWAVRLKKGVPGGESVAEIQKRLTKFVIETEEKYQAKNILVVSHGDPLAQLIAIFTGKDTLEVWQNNYLSTGQTIKFSKIFKHEKMNFFDPHRPFIDEITFKCEKCGGMMKRIPEVMDCWFDSGAMPLAQEHYPFSLTQVHTDKNTDLHRKEISYPADFICEAIDQTRGWFYTLLAVATLMNKEAPYKNVICLGHVLDKNGQKMSKHIGNVVDPWQMMEKYGADVVRWYLYTVNQPGDPKRFDESFLKEAARMFNTLFNVLAFYQTYVEHTNNDANTPRILRGKCEYHANKLKNVLDKWMAAKLNLLIKEVTVSLEKYDLTNAGRIMEEFINDLSIWYVRRSRERFKSEDAEDKNQAIFTLGKVLFELAKILAPFIPFSAEYVYQELGKNCGTLKESVHLEDWPIVKEDLIDKQILEEMEMVRKIVELGLAKRAEAGVKVRQPLNKSKIKNQKSKLNEEYLNLIKDEINVKEVEQEQGEGELMVELDLEITEELKREGILRELVRTINNLRKENGLTIADQIKIYYQTEDELMQQVLEKYGAELKKQTLAEEVIAGSGGEETEINGLVVKLGVEKV